MKKTDVLIIGGGLAAMMAAIKLADHMHVTVVDKGTGKGANSWKAQGGIAAALSEYDCAEKHAADTFAAGCYKNNSSAVHILTQEGRQRLSYWISQGLTFDKTPDGMLSMGQEGAHSVRRILHAGGDQTGSRMMAFFTEKLKGRVEYITGLTAAELIMEEEFCRGVFFITENGNGLRISAGCTILATGGAGGLFSETSNGAGLTGDGLALAWKAGAALKDLEYIQFHPTLIISQKGVAGLASEALRGEGAVLRDEYGTAVMSNVHSMRDLAPRDVVARALYSRIQIGRRIYLDISHIPRFSQRFPQIARICSDAGIDWQKGRIPVKPGAHFHMGGIKTDVWGRTTVSGLYAVGEAACTGVHGANRLASNSLLEAIVFGERTGEGILKAQLFGKMTAQHQAYGERVLKLNANVPGMADIRKRVSEALGVVRHQAKLQEFIDWTEQYLDSRGHQTYRQQKRADIIQKNHMLIAARLIAKAALNNKESCGSHTIESIKERTGYEQALAETTVN